MREHFRKLNNENIAPQDDDIHTFTNSDNDDLNIQFTLEEIKCVIKSLKLGKACGLDRIRNEFIKNCPDSLLEIFVKYFNVVLDSGIVPEQWCIGVIIPIYKNKGTQDPERLSLDSGDNPCKPLISGYTTYECMTREARLSFYA